MLALRTAAEVNNTVHFELCGNSEAPKALLCEWMHVCMLVCLYKALCFTSILGSSTGWTATANNYACTMYTRTAAMGYTYYTLYIHQ